MTKHEVGSGHVTDELLARRILALEERVERVETTRPPNPELILDTLAELHRDTADRFDRLERRMDRVEGRLDGVERRLDQVITLLGGQPGPS